MPRIISRLIKRHKKLDTLERLNKPWIVTDTLNIPSRGYLNILMWVDSLVEYVYMYMVYWCCRVNTKANKWNNIFLAFEENWWKYHPTQSNLKSKFEFRNGKLLDDTIEIIIIATCRKQINWSKKKFFWFLSPICLAYFFFKTHIYIIC